MATITRTVLLFDEISVKLAAHQLRGKEGCKKSISEAIRERRASTIWWKGDLLRDFEDFNFLPSEIPRTR
jgi:hypothetical protein